MSLKVLFKPRSEEVEINGIRYSLEDLKRKIRNKTEESILQTLEICIEEEKNKRLYQVEIQFDDVSQLVLSDMFKGDDHSRHLLD